MWQINLACTVVSFLCSLLWIINISNADVFRSGKIPESLYTTYEQQCNKMAAEILEGSTLRLNIFVFDNVSVL